MPLALFFIKLMVSVVFVVTLSLIAENVSTKVAGLLSGYPLGAAIALFFFGLEIGPDFAAQSSTYTLTGLVATQTFVFVYYLVSASVKRLKVLKSSVLALSSYFLVIWPMHLIPLNRPLAVAIPVASIFGFVYLFRRIENVAIAKKIRLNPKVLFVRATVAAFMIVIITGAAKIVGPRWAGLFSAFPITLFPLMLIVHITYGTREVHTIIKNFPLGLGALITYALTVSFVYPAIGIYAGTLASFAAATLYLLGFRFVSRTLAKQTGR